MTIRNPSKLHALLAAVWLAVFATPSDAQRGPELVLLPDKLAQGSEVMAAISVTLTADVTLQFVLASGDAIDLVSVRTDRFGNALARAPLPSVAPGSYAVRVVRGPALLGAANLEVLARPVISLDPPEGVAGELVDVTVSGLPTGRTTIHVDGQRVIGPKVAEMGDLTGRFRAPAGGQAALSVVAQTRVGDRLVASAEAPFQRLRTEQAEVGAVSSSFPAPPHRRHTLRTFSGVVTLPDALAPEDYRWTLALALPDGPKIPVNAHDIRFTLVSQRGRSRQFTFEADMVIPSVLSGFDLIDLEQPMDGDLVYQKPDTGESQNDGGFSGVLDPSFAVQDAPLLAGSLTLEPLDFEFADQFGIQIEGRVIDAGNQDGATNGLADVQVLVIAETPFIEPYQIGLDPIQILSRAPGDKVPTARANGLLFENTQLTAAANQLGVVSGAGSSCDRLFRVIQTDGNGNFSFAFSPEVTNFLNLHSNNLAELDSIIYGPGGAGSQTPPPFQDRFKIDINGLLSDPPFGRPSSLLLNSYTGVSYSFVRDQDTGLYFFCEPGFEGCTDQFDPASSLVTSLSSAPAGVPKAIQTPIVIEGLAPPVADKQVAVFNGLTTFPQEAGNTGLESATMLIALNWDDIGLGTPAAAVSLDGVGSFAMQKLATQACITGYAVYGAEVPGLATRSGPITGSIDVESASGTFFKPIRIETTPGPTWFSDGNRYQQPVPITWSPGAISIVAQELPKNQDVSRDVGAVGLDTLNNDNAVDGFVTQVITGGQVNEQKRAADGDVTVMNNNDGFASRWLSLQPGTTRFSEEHVLAVKADFSKSARQDLLDRPGEPTFGEKEDQVILGGAFMPIARYAWGAPPVIGALFGIDLTFAVKLLNFGYVQVTIDQVRVDSITEPQSFIGLSIFFDLSVFIVSGSISADPTIGVGMPIIITNSTLNKQESKPCFQFELPLTFKLSVGPCPLCISASNTTVPVDFAEPSQCVIGSDNRSPSEDQSRGLADFPTPDGLALATNGVGQSVALVVDETGITAQNIMAGLPDTFEQLTTGRGAIKPDIAWYQQNAAVALWSQSSLSESAYEAEVAADYDCTRADNQTQPDCDDQVGFDAYQFQHMWYSTYNGFAWSLPTPLTAPNTGEGNVRLASCPQSDPACPLGGEVFAVWQRMNGTLEDRDVKLYYAFFDGIGWTAPTLLDAGPGAHQQAAPVYLDGEPVVFWVYNPTPLELDMSMRFDSRQLVYQFPREAAGTQVAPGFPGWIASPDAAADTGIVHLVYTANNAADPFFGTRRALHSATVENCAAGICSSFSTQKQQDLFGRDIFVEQPAVALNGAGVPTAIYRWVGTGGQSVANDPFGSIGTGDSAMSVITAGQPMTEVLPMTVDGQVNWQTQAVYDASIGSFLSVNTQVPDLQFTRSAANLDVNRTVLGSVRRHKLGGGGDATLFEVPDLPDLTIKDARIVGPRVVQGDDVITVQVTVANVGLPLAGSTSVEAWWDGPPGMGTLLGGVGGISFTDPEGTLVEFSIDIPGDVLADERHRLELIVNADGTYEESVGDNNAYYLPLNGLPVPDDIRGFADLAGTTAFLQWEDPADARIAGYRIYRRDVGSEDVMQAGISPRTGFVDVMSIAGESYEYCVSSYSERLMESDCSEWVGVAVKALPGFVMFRDGFE